jgi:hypothetical protein
MDYRDIFTDIAEKLFDRNLINSDEKIKLLNIISRDESLLRKVS